MATSARDKIKAGGEARIVGIPETTAQWGPPGGSMVISTPAEVDALIATIPKGRLATINGLREALARRHRADVACPITTGIFTSIAAKAAAEREMMGAKRVTPWWRVIKSDGTLNPRMPGGVAEHRRRLEAEGFSVVKKGRVSLAVADFAKKLAKLC